MKTVYILIITTHIGDYFDSEVWDVYSDANAAVKAAEEHAEFRKSRGFYELPTKSDPLYVKWIRLRKRDNFNVLREIMVQKKTVL